MNSPQSINTASSRLTQEDVSKLLNEPAAGTRVEVAKKIASSHAAGHFKAAELEVAEQIFRLLLRDAEVQVRAALAEGLKQDPRAPKDVIKSLAIDVDDVSVPVLSHSDVLSDEDLIDIIQNHGEVTKHIAIANRERVSGNVSAALVETENEEVVTNLVQNEGAEIFDKSYKKIVSDFQGNDALLHTVIGRSQLPVAAVEELLSVVSDSVAQELKQRHKGAARQLEEETRKARERMTLQLLDNAIEPDDVQALVNQLSDNRRLTPSIILTGLCRGNFAFFEVSLAKLVGIPAENARKLINDKGELGFKSLYKKAGLPESMFDACKLLLEVMREMAEKKESQPGSIHYANRAVEKLLTRARGREVENLAYIIALIRQNAH